MEYACQWKIYSKKFVTKLTGTNCNCPNLDEIRPGYRFDETCQRTVPPAIISFLESVDFEDAVRKSISLGGDADTLAAITGSIAEDFYGGVPEEIGNEVWKRIPEELQNIVERFNKKVFD